MTDLCEQNRPTDLGNVCGNDLGIEYMPVSITQARMRGPGGLRPETPG